MHHVETIAINRSASEVWELVGNPSNWGQWEQGMADVRIDGELATGAGITYKWRGKERSGTITRFIRNQEIGIKGEEGNHGFSQHIALRGIGSMTNVTMSMGFDPKAWWGTALVPFLFAVKKVSMGLPMRRALKALRQEAEKSEQPVAA